MSSTVPSPRYYVYVLARPNNKPFYVGKGARRRIYDHENEARKGHECYKCRIIRKIWREGGEVQRYTLFTTNDEKEAHAYEMELIALYGRHTLVNLTDGGEGVSGRVSSDATKKKRSDSLKARYQSDPVYKQLVLDRLSVMHEKRRGQKAKERAISLEEHERLSARAKNQWENTDLRSKVSESMKARWADPEFRARMSEKAKAQRAREERAKGPAAEAPTNGRH